MSRVATGNVYQSRDRWYARVSLGGGERPNYALPTCTTEEAARARLAFMNEIVAKLRVAGQIELVHEILERAAQREGAALEAVRKVVDGIAGGAYTAAGHAAAGELMTIQKLGEQWTSGKLNEKHPDHVKAKKTADDDAGRLELYVYPEVGDIPVTAFTIDHADRVMNALPRERAAGTRRHIAQLMHRLLAIAVFPLRAIKANPIPPGYLPSPGPRKAFGYLYPADDRLLMAGQHAHSEELVPLHWRLLEGFLAREGMRSGEAVALNWGDLDLKRGALKLDENKTDDPRAWAMHWGTTAALKLWRSHLDGLLGKRNASDAVFVDAEGVRLSAEHLAARLRDHLEAVGVDRPELFESTAARRKLRAHDLRATFITLSLAAGKSETFVADRTGHRSSQQINGYRRAARTAEELGLGELTPLVLAIPELAASWRSDREPAQVDVENDANDGENKAIAANLASLGSGAARHTGSTPVSCTSSESLTDSARGEEPPSRPPPIEGGNAANWDARAALGRAQRIAAAAAEAGQWDVARAQTEIASGLLRELEATRVAGASNVVSLRARRGGS